MTQQRKPPSITVIHNDVTDPEYTPEELEGFKTQSIRTTQHIIMLEEELKNKQAQLKGLKKLIAENTN